MDILIAAFGLYKGGEIGWLEQAPDGTFAYQPIYYRNGASRALYNGYYKQFMPRIGFAWDMGGKGKTVVRGGYNIAYDIFSQDFFTGQIFFNSFNAGPAYNAIGPRPVFFSFTTTGPLVPGAPVYDPASFSTDTTDAATVARNLPTPYVQTFSLNIQQELFRDTVVQVGYVNSGGRKLFRFRDINQS
jgi:hypothetical protein